MKYENIVEGKFLSRPNRFIANVEINGTVEKVHVKNTGRCRELLIPDATVYLEDFEGRMGTRKLRYSLIGVVKGSLMINMDSQAPNKVCEESLRSGGLILPGMEKLSLIRREKTYGASRLDFYVEAMDENSDGRDKSKCGWLEVKGVTLENDGVVRFPDAPTERGVKHIYELCKAREEGYNAYILFVVQMEGMKYFTPNDDTDRAFGDALRFAEKKGVKILIYDCIVAPDMLILNSSLTKKL